MGAVSENPYTSQTILGFNASPPPDDGSESTLNKLEWAKHKTKLADPVKTLAEAVNTAVTNAFAKSINTDAGVRNQLSGSFGYEWATATIGTDIIAADASAIAVGTEAGATQDTLQEITATGVFSGAQLVLKQRNATEEVNVIHATSTAATATNPNIFLGGNEDLLLDSRQKSLVLVFDDQVATATGWYESGRSSSSGLPAPDFTSAEQTVTLNSDLQVPHSLGVKPSLYEVALRCDTSNVGYVAGEEIVFYAYTPSSIDTGATPRRNATDISIVTGNSVELLDPGTFNEAAITATSWRYVVKAWK